MPLKSYPTKPSPAQMQDYVSQLSQAELVEVIQLVWETGLEEFHDITRAVADMLFFKMRGQFPPPAGSEYEYPYSMLQNRVRTVLETVNF